MNREPMTADEAVLSAYLDGECTAAERAWVEEQLAVSSELQAQLEEVRAARDAVRSLPLRDAPPEFWDRLLEGSADPAATDGGLEGATGTAPIELAPRRRRGPGRWIAAVGGAAAAAVIAAVVLVPSQDPVTPPVATFTDAHAVRSSLQDDAISTLAPLAVHAGFRR